MFTRIYNLFNRINNRFTYRQRFIFFSFVFILTTPFPGYWLLQVQNFFINRSEWQLIGNKFQDATAEAIYDILSHRVLTDPDLHINRRIRGSELDLFQASLDQQIQQLKRLSSDTKFIVQPSLGNGFSETDAEPINFENVYSLWVKTADSARVADTVEFHRYHDMLINELESILRRIRNTFQLTVAPTLTQLNLLDTAIIFIPTSQKLVTQLCHLETLIRNKPSPELLLEKLILINQLKDNLKTTDDKIDFAYHTFLFHSGNEKSSLTSAREAYIDYQRLMQDYIEDLLNGNPVANSAVNKLLETGQAVRDSNTKMANILIQSQARWYTIARNFSLSVYTFVAITLIFYITFKVLTRHLMEICYHLREMTKGNFKECFCSHFNDEFGMIGRTFDKMSISIQDVLGELKNVGSQLSGSIHQITTTAKTQGDNVAEQERQIHDIEDISRAIAKESRRLADIMSELSQGYVESSVADSAKTGLEHMQSKMNELATASNDIIQSLSNLQEKISSSGNLIAFLGKVSDQASLLSLNSAIETANIVKYKSNFTKITDEIKRFAEKTHDASHEIAKIIREISSSMSHVKKDAEGCLREITQGAQRLINVSNQLSRITSQGREQIKKFENVNDVMQMQALAAENIIASISNLSDTAEENTRSIHQLHQNIEDLGKTADELQKTIGLFV